MRCSVFLCVAVCSRFLKSVTQQFLTRFLVWTQYTVFQCVVMCCNVLSCVAVCCHFHMYVTQRFCKSFSHVNTTHCVADCCSVLSGVAACCSALSRPQLRDQTIFFEHVHIYVHLWVNTCPHLWHQEQQYTLRKRKSVLVWVWYLFFRFHIWMTHQSWVAYVWKRLNGHQTHKKTGLSRAHRCRLCQNSWHAFPHTATYCNTLQHKASLLILLEHITLCCSVLQYLCCSMLQYVAVCCSHIWGVMHHTWFCSSRSLLMVSNFSTCISAYCNKLQQTATDCNTLLYTSTQYNTLQHTWSCSSLLLPLVSNFLKNISISGLACSHVRHTSNATWMQHLCVYVYVYICMYIYIHISGLTQNKHLALDVFPCAPHMLPCAPHTLPCAPHIPRHLNFTTFVFVYICLYIYVYLFWLRHTCSHVRHTSNTTWFLQHLCTYIYVCIYVYVYICILILVNKFF